MTFLAITKQVDAVITEDSDLIAFGCPRIIYKMDKYGQGVQFQYEMLQHNKDLSFMGFTNDMVLEMCILSGCDYLPSLPGMGLKRAHALISKFKTYVKVIKHLRYSSVAVPPLYEESFRQAVWTVRHQRVYDLNKEDIVHLSNITENFDGDLDFLGPSMPQHVATAIANGELDPITRMPFQGNGIPNPALSSNELKNYSNGKDARKLELPAQKNVLTNYFCFASLEAKRKFKAPRVSPSDADSTDESSPASEKEACEDSDACMTKDSSGSVLGAAGPNDAMFPQKLMGLEFFKTETQELHSPLEDSGGQAMEKSSHPIHKPCILLRKGCDEGPGSSIVLDKTHHHATVRSDADNKIDKVMLRSSYFMDKPNDNDSAKGSKKLIIRSSYFKHKPKETTSTDENNRSLLKDGSLTTGGNENTISVMDSMENSHSKDLVTKRKYSPDHINSEEHVKNKRALTKTCGSKRC